MADEQNTIPETPKDDMMRCPCCGEMTLHKPLEIKSIVLDEYMASIITGVPFSHTYTIHDTIDVTVEMPLKKDVMALQRAVSLLDKVRLACKDADKSYKLRDAAAMVQVYGNITSIVTRKDGKIVKSYTPAENVRGFVSALRDLNENVDLIIEAYEACDTTDNMSTIPEVMLNAIVRTHGDMYKVLLDTGFNETFWKGIELV